MNKFAAKPDGVSVEDNQDSIEIDKNMVRRLAEYILAAEDAADRGELSITFVDSEEMASLNVQYRDKEGPTDVLSFLMADSGDDDFVTPVPLLGNIVICPEVAAANTAEENGDTQNEICLLVAHGLLHVLGYGHATDKEKTAMFNRQSELAQEFLKGAGKARK